MKFSQDFFLKKDNIFAKCETFKLIKIHKCLKNIITHKHYQKELVWVVRYVNCKLLAESINKIISYRHKKGLLN